ncbi:hypothetical protein H9P43_005714 [Blastocladiella emersonii ATCC 22665]|nr:hypothetical protein H9P43_005714 [Blastocladiella emersonii ATCC 22665]
MSKNTIASADMKGLHTFISDIRACRSRDAEEKRINKELGHIRQKFKEGGMSGYERKKYVCKLVYMYILGYRIDFGHVEAANLLASPKYKEKQIGYLAVTLLFNENSDAVHLVVNSFKKDLDADSDVVNCLVLNAIANIGGTQLAETLGPDVVKKLTSPAGSPFIKKKAALCLLKLYRKHPSTFVPSEWAERAVALLTHHDLGVVTSAASLLNHVVAENPSAWIMALPKTLDRLHQIVVQRAYAATDLYYKIPVPWLQIKLLRLLQNYEPPHAPSERSTALAVLHAILAATQDQPKHQQQLNALNAVFFEAVRLILHWQLEPQHNAPLVAEVAKMLARFMGAKDSNARYLALEVYAMMLNAGVPIPGLHALEGTIVAACRDRDNSVRQQALDVLYRMADATTGPGIVTELLRLLGTTEASTKEVLVLRIAILAEKFAPSFEWYFHTLCEVLLKAPEFTSDDVWHRIVQRFSALPADNATADMLRMLYEQVRLPSCPEKLLCLTMYLLGERADALCPDDSANAVPPTDIFHALYYHYTYLAPAAKAQALTTFVKLVNLFPEIKPLVAQVLSEHANDLDLELQERACEYLALLRAPDHVLIAICEQMPAYTDRQSALESRLAEKEAKKKAGAAGSTTTAPPSPTHAEASGPPQLLMDTMGQSAKATIPRGGGGASPYSAGSGGSGGGIMDDLLGMSASPGYAPVPVSPTPAAPAANAAEAQQRLFARFFHAREGVVYQDATIQIGAVVDVGPHLGPGVANVVLYLGNKTGVALDAVQVDVASCPEVSVQVSDAPRSIAPGTQERVGIACAFRGGAPSGPVQARVRFAAPVATPTELVFRLPALLTYFCDPIVATADQWAAQWARLAAVAPDTPVVLRPAGVGARVHLAWLRQTLEGMRWQAIEDPADPRVLRACAKLVLPPEAVAAGGGGGQFCLLEVRCSDTFAECQVTVRSAPTAKASAAVKEAVGYLVTVSMPAVAPAAAAAAVAPNPFGL